MPKQLKTRKQWKRKGKHYYILALGLDKLWKLSLVTPDQDQAAIRFADLKTVAVAVAATGHEKLAEKLDGQHYDKSKKLAAKCGKLERGLVMKEILRTREGLREYTAGDRGRIRFVEARAASMTSDGMRPGLAFNYFRGPSGTIYHTGLTKRQRMHLRQQRDLRQQAGLRENATV